jgi:hypothetical protein
MTMLKNPASKYKPFAPVGLRDRQWPDAVLTRPPIWCSVDLRDGNQSLIEPMDMARKLRMFELLVAMGFKEIEVGFPSSSQVEFDFVRKLIEEDLIPQDVTIQVLSQAREHLIRRTFEALQGARRAIVHLYNATAPVMRRVVLGLSEDGIVELAVENARLLKSLAAEQPATEWVFQYSPEMFSGTELHFAVVDASGNATAEQITVFTTRPDTIYGVSYVVLAPEHPLVAQLTSGDQQLQVEAFCDLVSGQSEQERTAEDKPKRGVPLGSMVRNPASGELLPLWIADYVLAEYGTGAVMGVPAHDQRDFLFARQYELPVKQVIIPEGSDEHAYEGGAWTEAGMLIHSGEFDGLQSSEAKLAITRAAELGGWGQGRVQYRLRDWLISRQRYWGCPIPVIHCPSCGVVPVPAEQLPVELPRTEAFTGKGGSPLAQLQDWLNVTCPLCGQPAQRETDTMDTFMCSSWYYLRYSDPHNTELPFERQKVDRWLPVDQYVGGIEHAILHLL